MQQSALIYALIIATGLTRDLNLTSASSLNFLSNLKSAQSLIRKEIQITEEIISINTNKLELLNLLYEKSFEESFKFNETLISQLSALAKSKKLAPVEDSFDFKSKFLNHMQKLSSFKLSRNPDMTFLFNF